MNCLQTAQSNELDPSRRPVKARSSTTIRAVASALANVGVTPNQVSCASMVFAGLSSACMIPSAVAPSNARVILLMFSALFIQMRLLCNVLDGLIAIEGGKRTKYGELFNEIPDRISDTVLLVSAGYSCGSPEFGWAAGMCALGTAYVRAIGAQFNREQDFGGPMAKQQRMFVLTLALVARALLDQEPGAGMIVSSALILITVGSVVTCGRRLLNTVKFISAHK